MPLNIAGEIDACEIDCAPAEDNGISKSGTHGIGASKAARVIPPCAMDTLRPSPAAELRPVRHRLG